MRRWFWLLIIFYMTSISASGPVRSRLNIEEEDGTPTTYPYKLKVTNGTLTDNGDGTASLSTGGGGAGSGTMNAVEDDDSQVGGSDITTLDFGDGFTLSESPDKEINLSIDAETDFFKFTSGTLDLSTNFHTQVHGWNGQILETIDIDITESGGTVSLELEQSGGGDLTIFFSDDYYTLDCTPAQSVALTAGSDTSPQINYVYVLQSNKTLTVSTTSFPATEHAPVATVMLQSVASEATDGPYKVHAWTDHSIGTDNMGHVAHLNHWIRHQPATWMTGVATTPDITINGGAADNVDIATSSGTVLQLHDHTFPAFDTSTGSDIYVVNDSVTAYDKITDLNALLTDSDGDTLVNKSFSFVIWGVVSEKDADSKLFLNLPSGSYNSSSSAIADLSAFSNYTIPTNYIGTGFLIAKLTFSHSSAASGTWTLDENEDLRGQIPTIAAGGAATGVTNFPDNVFTIYDDTDSTKITAFQASGITTGNTRTLTVPDQDGTIVVSDSDATLKSLKIDDTITAAGGNRYVDMSVNDTTDNFELTREDTNILAFGVGMPILVGGVDQVVSDSILNVTANCLVAWYCNDNAATVTVLDGTANGLDATASANTSTMTTGGKINQAFNIVQGGNYFSATAPASLNLGDVAQSYEIWWNPDWVNQGYSLISRSTGASWSFILNQSNQSVWTRFANGGNYIGRNSSNELTVASAWYHIIVTWDGTASSDGIDIYINGSIADISNNQGGSFSGIDNTAYDVNVMYLQGAQDADGQVDCVRIYDIELTQAQVTALYNSGSGRETTEDPGAKTTNAIGTTSNVTTSHDLDSLQDLIIEGDLEVEGTTFLDGTLTAGGAATVGGTLGVTGNTTLSGTLTVGSNQWDDGSDLIDGEQIAANTIDDDSIDFADVTMRDLTNDMNYRMIKGMIAAYTSSTSITFQEGQGMCNGNFWETTSDTAHSMTSLASGADFHYVYIDDDASSYPTPTIIDSTTEPTWTTSGDNWGWYNGDDRCIFSISSPDAVSTIDEFFMDELNRVTLNYRLQIASDMNPDFTWVSPDDYDTSEVTPVNIDEVQIHLFGTDSGSECRIYATPQELATMSEYPSLSAFWYAKFYNSGDFIIWCPVGTSRIVKISGDDNDDSLMKCWFQGYRINR